MTLNVKQKRISPDSTPSVSKSFINQSMSSSTDKSEEEDVFGEDMNGDVVPKRFEVISRYKIISCKYVVHHVYMQFCICIRGYFDSELF